MKINRLTPAFPDPDPKRHIQEKKIKKTARRKRYVKDDPAASTAAFMSKLNEINKFSYLDYERNKGAIELFKTQVNQIINNYGCDLQYFRKYNTFFKGDDENNSNLIYGEDTTAEYYASGMIRSFVSVENMAWNFNQLGIENTEQVNLFISIDSFSQIFANDISKIETQYFEVPISGNLINCEGLGKIRTNEFDADVYVTFEDDLKVKHANIKMIPKRVNSLFYKSLSYNTTLYEISGDLTGKLKRDKYYPLIVSGVIKGELTYHNYENVEDSETWQLAPQVGDYFKFQVPTGIDEEWEITQVFDRILTNKSGINPLLGKYIYQCAAIKRVQSHEKTKLELDAREPGNDIDEIFNQSKAKQQQFADQFTVDKNKENKHNKKTNRIAKNVYDYIDKSDETYGGYQNMPNSK